MKKVRQRTRPTTTTETPTETTRRTVAVRTRAPYNRNTNRESSRDRGTDEEIKVKAPREIHESIRLNFFRSTNLQPRFRIRENTPRFRLDTQESQWSSRFNQNSFQPVEEEKTKNSQFDDEQEIVTASPDDEKVENHFKFAPTCR